MKTKFLLTATILLTFFISYSCEKDQIQPSKEITGNWEWVKSVTVYPSEPKTPQNTGITEIIEFRSDKKWLKIQNDIHIDSGTYSTGHGSYSSYSGASVFVYDSIVYRDYSSNVISHDYYDVYNDTLQFCGGFAGLYDGGSDFYIKK